MTRTLEQNQQIFVQAVVVRHGTLDQEVGWSGPGLGSAWNGEGGGGGGTRGGVKRVYFFKSNKSLLFTVMQCIK